MHFSTSSARAASTRLQQQQQHEPHLQPLEPAQKSFTSLESFVHQNTLKAITQTPYNHVHMSPVQEKILGMISEVVDTKEGKDLLVRAKTGTGKTLAFLVPAIERRLRILDQQADEEVMKDGLGDAVRLRTLNRLARETMGVLVISPTRELATQIALTATNLSVHHAKGGMGFGVQLFVGGENRGRQMKQWVAGRKDIVVGTPGRLRDLLESWNWESRGTGGRTGDASLKEVFGRSGNCVVVLDEADTLLDMGFRKDVEAITEYLKQGRGAEGKQTWLFSATVGKGVEGIVRQVMRPGKWEYVDCVGQNDEKDVHGHVRQMHTIVGDGGGMGAFVHLLRLIVHDQLNVMKRIREGEKDVRSKMIIFFSTTRMTRLFGKLLRECAEQGSIFPFKKMGLYEMHSKKEMSERVKISKEFRERKVDADEGLVMVTSDVSARGVDYPGVGRVVQMGIPGSREGYVHRVGRTGRGDVKEGRGDLVLAPWEMGFLKVLGDVGMEPITVEGLKDEIEGLAAELESQGYAKGELVKKVARIEDVARNVASVSVAEDRGAWTLMGHGEYKAAWASMVGFYVGHSEGLGRLTDVIDGSGRWVEALGNLEKGMLAVGPDSGLPPGLLNALRKDYQKALGRGRGGKEKAWGSWSRNDESRSQADRHGGWRERPRHGEEKNQSDRYGGWRERPRSDEGSNQTDRYGGWRDQPKTEEWRSQTDRQGGWRSRTEEGTDRQGGWRGSQSRTEEGTRRGGMKKTPSWMGRGSSKVKRRGGYNQ